MYVFQPFKNVKATLSLGIHKNGPQVANHCIWHEKKGIEEEKSKSKKKYKALITDNEHQKEIYSSYDGINGLDYSRKRQQLTDSKNQVE